MLPPIVNRDPGDESAGDFGKTRWAWQAPKGFEFFGNIFDSHRFESRQVVTSVEEQITRLVEQYGMDNLVILDDAYDRNRKLVPGGKAVFIRKGEVN